LIFAGSTLYSRRVDFKQFLQALCSYCSFPALRSRPARSTFVFFVQFVPLLPTLMNIWTRQYRERMVCELAHKYKLLLKIIVTCIYYLLVSSYVGTRMFTDLEYSLVLLFTSFSISPKFISFFSNFFCFSGMHFSVVNRLFRFCNEKILHFYKILVEYGNTFGTFVAS